MAKDNLKERLGDDLFLLDGAMGTELIARGIEAGKCNDYLCVEAADIVSDVHASYIQAGSDAVITNTFGANIFTLARHGYSDFVEKINSAAAIIARNAAGEDRYVLGDIGPSGEFLAPVGTLKADDLKAAFAEQAKGLLAGGVDGFIIETMTAIDEAVAAVEGIKSVSDLPILVSFSYSKAGEDFKTMMGASVEAIVEKIVALGVDAIGFNCGDLTMDQYVELAQKHLELLKDVPIMAELNAGHPKLVDGKTIYDLSADEYAKSAEKIKSAGVNIIGGCCGTNPAHIKAVADKLK